MCPKTNKTMQFTFLKSVLSASLLTMSLTGCTHQSSGPIVQHDAQSGYTIITDTVELDANQYISAVHKMALESVESYHGRYICQFYHHNYTSFLPILNLGYGHLLLSIAKDGQDVFQMPAPLDVREWNQGTTRIKVQQDTLYLYNTSKTYYWEEDARQWIETTGKISEVYEDESYTIYSEDKGEWGEYARFHEKQTGFDYLFEAPMITALKYDSDYYIVGPFQLRKVSDPHKGWEMDDSVKYGRWFSITPPAGIVYRTKYRSQIEYECADDHSQDTLFCSAFIRAGQMHFLMRDSANTFIAKYVKGRHGAIEKILSLGDIPIDYKHGRKNQNEVTHCIIQKDWTKDGIVNIGKDTIRIRYIKKQSDTLQYMGIQALEQVLDFVANNIGKVTMNEVRALEGKTGGRHDGHILETNREGHTTPEYQKKLMGPDFPSFEDGIEGGYELVNYYHAIDESDSFCVSYCYQNDSQTLTTVRIALYPTNYLSSKHNGFRRKCKISYEEFASMVSKCLSVEPDSKGVWRKGDVTISTFGRKNRFVIRTEQP